MSKESKSTAVQGILASLMLAIASFLGYWIGTGNCDQDNRQCDCPEPETKIQVKQEVRKEKKEKPAEPPTVIPRRPNSKPLLYHHFGEDREMLYWSRQKTGGEKTSFDSGRRLLLPKGGRLNRLKMRTDRLDFGPAPLLLSVGSQTCDPCVAELPELLKLVRFLRTGNPPLRFVFSLTDSGTGNASLTAAAYDLFDAYHEMFPNKPKLVFEDWIEFRPGQVWVEFANKYFAESAHDWPVDGEKAIREGGIPLTMLFDRCGNLRLLIQDRLDKGAIEKIEKQVVDLQNKPPVCQSR